MRRQTPDELRRRHLLLVGAYRDNEVTALHPLARRLDALRQSGAARSQVSTQNPASI